MNKLQPVKSNQQTGTKQIKSQAGTEQLKSIPWNHSPQINKLEPSKLKATNWNKATEINKLEQLN